MSRPALSATRALAVLDFLAAHPTDEFMLSDLAERLDINGASLHAILAVLTDTGYTSRHARRRTYTLGPSLVAVGSAALERHPAIDLGRDAARRLSAATGLEVAVTAVAGTEIAFVARAGVQRARGIDIHVGQRVPLAPPLGAVFMAWADDRRVHEWLDRVGDDEHRTELRTVLDIVRQRGFSVALEDDARRGIGAALDRLADTPHDISSARRIDQYVDELGRHDYHLVRLEPAQQYDVSMIAAPVFDGAGHATVALTLLGFDPLTSGADVLQLGQQVRDAALVVTKRSRGRVAPPP